MKQRVHLSLALVLVIAAECQGTHFLGAEVRYAPTGIEPYTYTIEVDMYTDLSSPADRPWILLNGVDTMPRILITDLPAPTTCGSIRLSTYRTSLTYPGPGVYILGFEDANRNGGIINIPNSIAQGVCLEALLVISPISGANTSITFDTLQTATRWEQNTLVHDPGAREEEGDSLSFELVAPKGLGCLPIAGYGIPAGATSAWVEEATGVFRWEAPEVFGEWNVTIRGSEYRNGQLIGQVTRDMTICVYPQDVGITQVAADGPFSIRPTLTDDVIWIDAEGTWDVVIMDASGRIVHSERNATKDGPLALSNLAEGTYSIRASSLSGVPHVARFVRTR
jgi:hypothetical protein